VESQGRPQFLRRTVNAFTDGSVNLGLIFAIPTVLVWNMVRRDQQSNTPLAQIGRRVINGDRSLQMKNRS
jgi:hypothetical protein